MRKSWILASLCVMWIASACTAEEHSHDLEHIHDDHIDHHHLEVFEDQQSVLSALVDRKLRFDRDEPFAQVGLFIDTSAQSDLRYRVLRDGVWSAPQPVDVTWEEEDHFVARVVLDSPARVIEFEGVQGISGASFEFFPEVQARLDGALTRDLPFEAYEDQGDYRVVRQQQAPASLVISRRQWGARSPDKVCGSAHNPYRMSIHHTAGPTTDGPDPAARMRSMQAYHIDVNGWCDIGYHFVVSQSGLIYQGRSTARRTGAHVRNQNAGNIGISLIGNFQTQTPRQGQLEATGRIMNWVHRTFNIPLNRTAVKGHREWPGQSTSCPGANLLSRFDTLLNLARAGGEPPPPPPPPAPNFEVDIEVDWIGISDIYKDGTSEGKPDVLPGVTFQAQIRVTNKTDGPIRGVRLGYFIEEPFIKATNYTIETDHPAKDGQTFVVNDADSAEENPAKDAMGRDGTLIMYAFSSGETKRVLIDLVAVEHSIGRADHPDVRGWIQNIDGAYQQNGFRDDPTVNQVGSTLRAWAELDVLSQDEWHFQTGQAEQLEGWSSCTTEPLELSVDTDLHALTALAGAAPMCLLSPEWTLVNASQHPEMVLSYMSSAPLTLEVSWATEASTFAPSQTATIELPQSAAATTAIVNFERIAGFEGNIIQWKLMPMMAQGHVFALDRIFFQSSSTQTTSSDIMDYVVDGLRINVDAGSVGTPPSLPGSDLDEFSGAAVTINAGGCASAGHGQGWPLLLLVMTGLFAIRRRR